MKVLSFVTVPEKQYRTLLAEFIASPQDAQMGCFVSQLTARLFMEALLGGCPVDDRPEGQGRFRKLVDDVYAFIDLFSDTVEAFKKLVYVDMDLEGARKALWPLIEAVKYEAYASYWLEHVELRPGRYYSAILDAFWDTDKGNVWHMADGRPVPGSPLPPTAELIIKALREARPERSVAKEAGESPAAAAADDRSVQIDKQTAPVPERATGGDGPEGAGAADEDAGIQTTASDEAVAASVGEGEEDIRPVGESETTGKEGE